MKHVIEQTTQPNGASVYLIQVADSPVVEAKISFACGSLLFAAEKHHLPHMLEHLLLSRSRRFKDEALLTRQLQRLGAHANAMTSFDELAVVLHAPAASFDEAYRAVWESVFGAMITAKNFDHERDVIRREIYERFDGLQNHLNNALYSEVFEHFPATIEEHLAGIDKLTEAEVRQAYEAYIVASNAKVIVSGNLSQAGRQTVNQLAASLASSAPALRQPTASHQTVKTAPDRRTVVNAISAEGQDSGLLMLNFVIPAPTDRKARAAKMLATGLLFDAPAAIIPGALRRQGLIYSWDTDLTQLKGYDLYAVSLTTNIGDLAPVAAEIFRLLTEAAYGKLDHEAFLDVRSFSELTLPTMQETAAELLQWYDSDIRHGYPFSDVDDEVALIGSESVHTVQQAVRTLFFGGDVYVTLAGSEAVPRWAADLERMVKQTRSEAHAGKPLRHRHDAFLATAHAKEATTAVSHDFFFGIYPFIMWVNLVIAVQVAYLPYANNPAATVAMFDTVYERDLWLWGVALFLPLLAGLVVSSLKDSRLRTLWFSGLFSASALAYLYGVVFIFGDIGKGAAPFWQDVASIVQPVSFLILTPLAMYWAIGAYAVQRRADAPVKTGQANS